MDFNHHAQNMPKFPLELPPNLQAQLQNLQKLQGLPPQALLNPSFLSQLQGQTQALPGAPQNKIPVPKVENQVSSTPVPKPVAAVPSAGLTTTQSATSLVQNSNQGGELAIGQASIQPGQPSKVDLAAMKDKIQKLMKMENLADITLAGYMIKLMRHRTKMSLKELHDEVSKCYDTLRRSDGSKYTGDVAKALKGCLTSSEVFKEVSENVWVIREKEAKIYEEKTTKKLKTLINKKKGRSGRKKEGEKTGANQDADGDSGDDSGDDSDASEEIEKAKPVKKLKTGPSLGVAVNPFPMPTTERGEYHRMADILDHACRTLRGNESTKNLLQNSLDNIIEGEPAELMLQKMGDRFLGILEGFEYFLPLIQEHLKINPGAKPIRPALNLLRNVKVEAGMPVVKQEYTAPKLPKAK